MMDKSLVFFNTSDISVHVVFKFHFLSKGFVVLKRVANQYNRSSVKSSYFCAMVGVIVGSMNRTRHAKVFTVFFENIANKTTRV